MWDRTVAPSIIYDINDISVEHRLLNDAGCICNV